MAYGLPQGGQRIVVADRASKVTGREVLLPNLRGHPDAPKFGPYDKEFWTGQMPTGYTVAGTLGAWDLNKTVPGHLYLSQPGSNTGYGGIMWQSPPGPFTVTCKVGANKLLPATSAASQQPQLHLSTATPSLSSSNPQVGIWTVGDGTTNVRPQAGVNSSFVTGASTPGYGILVPHYLRMIVTSGNAVTTQFSFDGYLWTTLNSAVASGITVGSFGFVVRDLTTAYAIAIQWIRVTTP